MVVKSRRGRFIWRAWHVPSLTGLSARTLTNRLAQAANAPPPQLLRLTAQEVHDAGRTDSIIAEVEEILYLQESPFKLNSSATSRTFAVQASSLADVINDTLKS